MRYWDYKVTFLSKAIIVAKIINGKELCIEVKSGKKKLQYNKQKEKQN